ncbi:MAG: hypothetical protein J6D00_00940 [Christensenellaceae bacterium]|nr:hypothetical protein [Christensenellaceae bacterium]
MMAKEITFLNIDGNYGGDQNWLPEHSMRRGGCSTVVAVELSACLRHIDKKYEALSPIGIYTSKEGFTEFSVEMFKYVYPKYRGLPSIHYFEECYNEYAASVGMQVEYAKLPEHSSYEEAENFLREWIDKGYPIACLVLEHESRLIWDITWHWFTLTGYEDTENGMDVIFGTYGEKCRLPFRSIWEKGNPEKRAEEGDVAGLIVIH